ncbi:MAG: hypothetical protein FWC39_13735 [Bacteroidetes bacterium]|nr:hypothetical protein [Bacteroidota bacterium]
MKSLFTAIFTFFVSICFCQCPINKPEWADNGVVSLPNSKIRPFYATGYTLEEAKEKVEEQKRKERANLKQRVDVDNGVINYSSGFDYSSGNVVEFHEKCGNQYHYWQMAQIVVDVGLNPIPEKVSWTDTYTFSELKFRPFIPGVAQIYKGNTPKGVGFILGHAGLGIGIGVAEGFRRTNEGKINTHDPNRRQYYIDQTNMYANIRNGLIAGTVALYAWNVIDGIVAKGKSHLQIAANVDMRVMPYAALNASGVTVAFKF